MVCAIAAICAKPSTVRWRPDRINCTTFANFSKSTAFAVKWVFFEERDDPEFEFTAGPHRKPVHGLPMIVVSVIATDLSASEVPPQEV